ncbi:MAG: T9SS type A sorting domain-containing protein [Cyclobacteriaceae bacterium]
MQKISFLILSSLLALSVSAQSLEITPEIDPTFFSADQEIKITYDVTGTSLSTLSDAWIWLWIPNNNNANVPTNVNPASSDATATDAAKFTKITNGGQVIFELSLTLTNFTGLSKDQIDKVGILLKGNDWSNGQTTDYVFELSSGFDLKVSSPVSSFKFYNENQVIAIDAATSETSDFTLYHDDEVVVTAENVSDFTHSFTVIADGSAHKLRLVAATDSEMDEFTHSYIVNPKVDNLSIPAGLHNGANYISATSAILVLTAPNKSNVFVLGDFNNWSLDQGYLMKKDGDKFWLTIDGLTSGKEYTYQYLIDGEILIADPYTRKVISSFDDGQVIQENRYPDLIKFPDQGYQEVAVLQTNQTEFDWSDESFVKPAKEDLVIYELLVRDFTEDRTFKAVTERLDYLDSLGINAIEFMPVNEFEGNLSWGYNPSFKLAVDKFYGTEDDLKELINEAHKRGMAVILDMVMNHHFGRSPLVKMDASGEFGPPTATNPWLNVSPKHDFNVGYDFNHESEYTKEYLDEVITFWVDEYHVDGYRFDLSKGFTQKNTLGNVGLWGQYDASRVALLERMADVIWAQNPETYVILEHLGENNEEKVLANYGMMLWGHMNSVFRSTAKGNASNIDWLYHGTRDWDEAGVVGYMESHDEERVQWDVARSSKNSFEYQMNRLKLNATFFFMVPGPKMIWQFGEFGYDVELNDDRLGVKPTKWEYLEDKERSRLFATYQSLINLKTKTGLIDDQYFSWEPEGSVKWINYNGPDTKVSIFGNFSKTERTGDPHFVEAGEWYNYFTGEKITVDNPNEEVELKPGEFYFYTSKPIDNYIQVDAIDFLTAISIEDPSIRIYPNPITDVMKVTANEAVSLEVLDLSGRVIRHSAGYYGEKQIDLAQLEAGLYIVKIYTPKGVVSRRVIKK